MKRFLLALLFIVLFIAGFFIITTIKLKKETNNAYQEAIANAPYDVIIVPGLPFDSVQQNSLLKVRILWAKTLFDKGITKNIIFSGNAVHTPWIEGRIMKTFADSLGIPLANTFEETNAEHGNENIFYSYQLAHQLGFKKIALATDQYQNAFLASFIKKQTSDIFQLPVSADSFSIYEKRKLPAINFHAAYVENFIPLKDRKSRWERIKTSFSTGKIQDKDK